MARQHCWTTWSETSSGREGTAGWDMLSVAAEGGLKDPGLVVSGKRREGYEEKAAERGFGGGEDGKCAGMIRQRIHIG